MRRREFMAIVSGAAVFAPLSGFAQETGRKQSGTAKLPGIGFLSNNAGEASTPLIAGVFAELQRLGWVNGRSAIYEPRISAGDPSRFPGFATDLVDRKVNVIFAGGHLAAKAVQSATTTIPIVALADDIEQAGLVTSIGRPERNITGVSIFGSELDEKRLELLVEMVPAARRMAVLAESKTRPSVVQVAANAHRLGIELVLIEAPSLDKLDSALDAVATARVDAVNVLASAILYNGRRAIIDRMAASRLPAIVHAKHTHEPPQPHPVPVLALEGAVSPLGISCGRFAGAHVRTRRFEARESDGCSRRIGSVLNGSAVRAVARSGTRRFAALTPRATAPLPSWNRVRKGTGIW